MKDIKIVRSEVQQRGADGTDRFSGQQERQVNMKKIISVLLAAAMALSALSSAAYAKSHYPDEGVVPMYESNTNVSSSMSAKNKNVECKSHIIVYSGEKWSTVTQTIEKQSASGNWTSTSHTWTKTADNQERSYNFTNSTTLSENGKYRLKSDVTVKLANGFTETITKYSSTITI